MKIFVTGAAGFIGSHVVEELIENGFEVKALAHYNSESHISNLRFVRTNKIKNHLEVVFGDICDRRCLHELTRNCDAIVHLAALIGIPYSYIAPGSYVMTNVLGTLNVLEVARDLGLQRIIVTSTSEVYGSAIYSPIDESHPLQAQSPYSASKIAADKLAESYYRTFDLPVVTLRPFNTFGPRQSLRAIIPTILSQLLSGKSQLRLGNLSPKRDLVFVRDTARAFRLALEKKGIEGETIHFGTGRATSVRQLAELCMEIVDHRVEIVEESIRIRPEKSEVELLLANSQKAKEAIGWESMFSIKDGLHQVAKFLRENTNLYTERSYFI
jgi:NAD dependent epimerase/dehydratase